MSNSRPSRPRSVVFASTLLMLLGILVALTGIAADYIFSGASPGFNLPQLLIVAAGLVLSLGGYRLRRSKHILGGFASRHIATVAVITLVTLLAIEIALTAFGTTTYYPREVSPIALRPVPWWHCDDAGCRFQYEAAVRACAAGEFSGKNSGRKCIVNQQGYADKDDFVLSDDAANRQRVLALGDSFTHGFTADIGRSYVETLKKALPEVVVWNAGITGNGTQEALAGFEELAPTLRPQLTFLGFYMNDFLDNLHQVGFGWIMARTPEGGLWEVRLHWLDRWGFSPSFLYEQDPGLQLAYARLKVHPPANEVERALGTTQLGTVLLKLLDRMTLPFYRSLSAHQVETTRQRLTDLRDAVSAQDSALLVLIIPAAEDFQAPGDEVRTAVSLMDELEIPYLNLLDVLSPEMYHDPLEDAHWNNAGHAKVGVLLTECVETFFASGDLADCKHVVMP